MTTLRRCTTSVLLSLPLAASAAPDPAAIRAIVDATVRPLMAEHDLPGVAVAVTVDGQSAIFNYGLASRADNKPIDNRTLFEIGSVSKTFAATLASYAQVQGKLALDDRPGKYWPALKGSAIDKATLLHLGTYTAGGLPLQFPDELTEPLPARYYRAWKPAGAPGTIREYSNPSLGLFGHMTARALKRDYGSAVESILFPAFGMQHSYVNVPAAARPDYAWGYLDGKAVHFTDEPFSAITYGIRTTAADLLRFVQANMTPQGLDPTMRRAVEGTHVGYFKVGDMVQGLGWEQYAYPTKLQTLLDGNSESMIWEPHPATRLQTPALPAGPTLFNKTGSTGGFGAYVLFVPEQKVGIVLLANRNYPIPARVKAAYAILERLTAQK
ncbi:class C beta-lactamase [Pseudoduganella chitinolytica]|uniref:Beta-lactamase n=1 Tax=Pseudoduganella chitinolytica TaxID=34070 RepID=A0ABY8B681_9BURK|nr:class C beta-lactamase [Pseudoduganella chitinolytica]WEF31441.1 beta-lactamase [Pseudoduganella chitinolytica]